MSKCDLIRDILPLVAEDMASEETKAFVHEHIARCPQCAAELGRMRKEIHPEAEEAVPLRAVRKELVRRRIDTIVLTAALVLALILPILSMMTRPIYREYDAETVYISTAEEHGRTIVNSVLMLDVQNAGWYWAEDSDRDGAALYIYAYDTLYDTLCGKKTMVTISQRQWPEGVPVTRVYYQQNDGSENVLVWGPETGERQITLPRLVLGYYLLMAAGAALVLAIAWLCMRRRFPRAGRVLARLCFAPACYIAAHVCVLAFHTVSYSAQRDCIFIWCIWAALYAACLSALRLMRR